MAGARLGAGGGGFSSARAYPRGEGCGIPGRKRFVLRPIPCLHCGGALRRESSARSAGPRLGMCKESMLAWYLERYQAFLYLAFNGRDVSGVSSALLFISVVRTALDDFDLVVPDAIDDAVGVVYPSAPPSRKVAS